MPKCPTCGAPCKVTLVASDRFAPEGDEVYEFIRQRYDRRMPGYSRIVAERNTRLLKEAVKRTRGKGK